MTRNSPPSISEPPAAAAHSGALVVLGLDPGTLVTGYGIIARDGERLALVTCGTITNPPDRPMGPRLRCIFDGLAALIERHHPDQCAIESAFYGKNAQSALKLGHARGVSLLAAVLGGLPAAEYAPREIKKAVVGNGNASKEQVRFMVGSLLGIARPAMDLDASDALAVAICHCHRVTPGTRPHRNWGSYVAAHPERVIR